MPLRPHRHNSVVLVSTLSAVIRGKRVPRLGALLCCCVWCFGLRGHGVDDFLGGDNGVGEV
jgi:hypothetical protein